MNISRSGGDGWRLSPALDSVTTTGFDRLKAKVFFLVFCFPFGFARSHQCQSWFSIELWSSVPLMLRSCEWQFQQNRKVLPEFGHQCDYDFLTGRIIFDAAIGAVIPVNGLRRGLTGLASFRSHFIPRLAWQFSNFADGWLILMMKPAKHFAWNSHANINQPTKQSHFHRRKDLFLIYFSNYVLHEIEFHPLVGLVFWKVAERIRAMTRGLFRFLLRQLWCCFVQMADLKVRYRLKAYHIHSIPEETQVCRTRTPTIFQQTTRNLIQSHDADRCRPTDTDENR